jgi:hypothetical protein
VLNHFEFNLADSLESISEISWLCLKLERYGMISEYVFLSIHEVLGHLYSKEMTKMNKAMGVPNGNTLGSDCSVIDLIAHVKDPQKFVADYRNTVVYVINSDRFI